MISGKIGVGIITYNRPEYFEQCYASVQAVSSNFDELVVVKDGGCVYPNLDTKSQIIDLSINSGVAVAKNLAWDYLITKGCDYLFLIEDDVIIKDPEVFSVYIETSIKTGVRHLMYSKVNENPKRTTIDYGGGVGLDLHRNYQGCFMYADASTVKDVGFFDGGFKNAFEHIDWSYRCALKGMSPPMWWSPDVINSDLYLGCIVGSYNNSSISNGSEYHSNVSLSADHWVEKYGYFTSDIKDTELSEVVKILKVIKGDSDENIDRH